MSLIGAAAVTGGLGLIGGFLQRGFEKKQQDTAVQRRVKDLKAAGLSPTLAAGSAAQSGGYTNPFQSATEKAQTAMALMTQKAQIDQTEAQKDLINLQKAGQLSYNRVMHGAERARIAEWMLKPQIAAGQLAEIAARTDTVLHNLDYARKHGVPTSGMDFKSRLGSFILDKVGRIGNPKSSVLKQMDDAVRAAAENAGIQWKGQRK